jgi:cyclic pyranopterin phosphate synthase
MIDITGKQVTQRTAAARARISLSDDALDAFRSGTLPKGRAEEVARIAGVLAAKKCAELIPYCHPIALEHVAVEVEAIEGGVEIRATTHATASTGVEMEALTAVSIAALTIYDMCKALDPAAVITEVRVLRKSGGKHGDLSFDEGEQ